LHEDDASQDVIRYADAFVRNGYNVRSIKGITMYTMEEGMEIASMTEGHRQLFVEFAISNTPISARTWANLLMSLEKCAPILACLQSTHQKRRRHTKSEPRSVVDGRSDTIVDDTTVERVGSTVDADESRVEAMLVKWKTTETLLDVAGNAFTVDDDDDDESTKGDDD
jgi:hypothetical protein